MAGRPRLDVGTYGAITTVRVDHGLHRAQTRYRDHDGVVRKVLATGASANDATAALRRKLLDRRRGGAVDAPLAPDSPFQDLAAAWLAQVQADVELSQGTKDSYERELRTLLVPALEPFSIREITTARVEQFLRAQRAKSYARAKHSKTLLRMVMNFALRQGVTDRNPVDGTSKLRKPPAPPKALTREQIDRIRTAARTWRTEPGVPGPRPDGQVRDLVEVMLGTATRIGEALALRRCDVDMTANPAVVHIRGTIVTHKGRGCYRQEWPKTSESDRIVAIPPFAAEVIRRRLALTAGKDDEHLMFFTRRGTPLYPHNVRRTFRSMLELAGFEEHEVVPHSFRKTGATLINAGAGEEAAKVALGHSSAATTRAHYIERTKEANPATAAILQGLAPGRGGAESDGTTS